MSNNHKLVRRQDLDFMLQDVLRLSDILELPAYADHDIEDFLAILDQAYRLAEESFAPLQRPMDEKEPWLRAGGEVNTFPGLGDILKKFFSLGFARLSFKEASGGFQFPVLLNQAVMSVFYSANISAIAYPVLTMAAARVLQSFGTEDQKDRYLMPMLEGRAFGTMALTEPQAGSSLADIRTKAFPDETGSYLIEGTKIFISGGDQDLSENIIHLVLAREQGAPAGVSGLSLYIVPKFLENSQGQPKELNGVELTGLIHKMGYRGTTSTLLSFGGNMPCRADRIGEAGKGLHYMFQMMNEARIVVGTGAASLAYAGFMHAKSYAQDRLQGRSFSTKDPSAPQVPLQSHPVVKKDLLKQKAYSEGSLCLCLYGAALIDLAEQQPDAEEREGAGELLDLLTPVIKSWPSKFGLEVNDMAIQMHGGYGYTRDFQVEQLYRDNRLNPIHEGTHTIQSFDLANRKLGQKNGAGVVYLLKKLRTDIEKLNACDDHAGELAGVLQQSFVSLLEKWKSLQDKNSQEQLSVHAPEFLDLFGHHMIGWMWVKQALATYGPSPSDQSKVFLKGKRAAFYWFISSEIVTLKSRIDGLGLWEIDLQENEPDIY